MGWLFRPHVVWAFRAERRLEQALVRGHVTGGAAIATEERMSQLNHILAAVFPGARNVLVLDQFLGFRYRPEEHILLIEVRDSKRPGGDRGVAVSEDDRVVVLAVFVQELHQGREGGAAAAPISTERRARLSDTGAPLTSVSNWITSIPSTPYLKNRLMTEKPSARSGSLLEPDTSTANSRHVVKSYRLPMYGKP